MNINQVSLANNYNFVMGSKYLWEIWDSEVQIVTIQTESKAGLGNAYVDIYGEVLKLTAEVPNQDICYCWFNKKFKKLMKEEAKKRNHNYLIAWDNVKYTVIKTEDEMLNIINSLTNNKKLTFNH